MQETSPSPRQVFIHADIVNTILASACGYAAFSMMPADVAVLTVEYKINLLRPAKGGLPHRAGARSPIGEDATVCAGDVVAQIGGTENVVATMLATIMAFSNGTTSNSRTQFTTRAHLRRMRRCPRFARRHGVPR
jgi:acyl-coenzyme A thioesterase PaaI-like protein